MPDWKAFKFIYIYGTGTFGGNVFETLTRHGLRVAGFLDHLIRQSPVNGYACNTPESISSELRSQAVVLIGIHNRDARVAEIISRLKGLGFDRIVTPVEFYDDFYSDLGIRYWLTERSFYADHADEIRSTAALFSDPISRTTLESILQFRTTGDYNLLPPPDFEHQYYPMDLPAWKVPLRFVDCGAYDGDTLINILASGMSIQAVAAFEPDSSSFTKLVKTIHAKNIPNAFLWPCGVYSSSTQLRFSTGKGEASQIAAAGESVIQCVSLDESLPDFAPTLIKMDIEGAELEALRGARAIIAKYSPGLAISVYHVPSHLWEIPLWVADLAEQNGLQYTYHLRSHNYNGFETIFYAVPAASDPK